MKKRKRKWNMKKSKNSMKEILKRKVNKKRIKNLDY